MAGQPTAEESPATEGTPQSPAWPGRPLDPRHWTLRTKLLASLVLLFAGVTAAIGAATVVTMRQVLVTQVDERLQAAAQTLDDDAHTDDDWAVPGSPEGRHLDASCRRAPPNAGEGFLRVCLVGSTPVSGYVISGRRLAAVPDDALAGLSALAPDRPGEDRPQGATLGSLGQYRVLVTRSPATQTVVLSGAPLRFAEKAVANLLQIVALCSLLGLIIVLVAGTWLVTSTLRPLRRVAATASRVSRLPMSSGEVSLAERVEPRDTTPGTEVGQVGAALNELLDHVDRSLTARHQSETRLRQFVADASHELRTPLASILGYAELTRKEPQPIPPGVRHAVGRIESESRRMASLVDDLLLLARLDSGRPLAATEVDLTRVVIDAVSDLRAAGPDHRWQLDLPDQAVELTGDQSRLTQVVVNLLNNARVHTPAGTTVTARLSRDDGIATLQVEDDGPGIPAELIPDVFERFTRGDRARTRQSGSSGLGLSIVQAVVAAHHGRTDVASRPGRTVVTVTLPVRPTVAADHGPAPNG